MKDSVFPIGLRLHDRLCLLVGSSDEVSQRTQSLLRRGARIRLLTNNIDALERFSGNDDVTIHSRPFTEADFDDVWLAVLVDQDERLATLMHRTAESRQTFFCAIDQPHESSYSHLARVEAGALTVGISTNGRAPALARRLREELERVFRAADLQRFVEELAELRARLSSNQRREVLRRLVSSVQLTGEIQLPVLPKDEFPSDRS